MNISISTPLFVNQGKLIENKLKFLISDDYQLNIKIPDICDLVFCCNRLSLDNYINLEIIEANWNQDKEKAGVIRNKKLVQNADFIIVYNDGKCLRTKHLIEIANQHNIPIDIILIENLNEELISNGNESIQTLLRDIQAIHVEKKKAIDEKNYEFAAKLRDDERKLKLRIESSANFEN